MKQLKLLTILMLVLVLDSKGQKNDTTLTDHYLLDFSVPDVPAFKALGTDPSNILRPSDIQKFSASLSPFYSNKNGVIPQNFALELAPWKLGSKKWKIEDYNCVNAILYNTAFSLGTIRDSSNNSSKISIGGRISFTSKSGDLIKTMNAKDQLSRKLQTEVTEFQRNNQIIYDRYFIYWTTTVLKLSNVEAAQAASDTNRRKEFTKYYYSIARNPESVHDTTEKRLFKEMKNLFGLTNTENDLMKFTGDSIDNIIAKFKADNWNARRFDIAVAWVGSSPDTLLKNSYFSSFNIWTTLALKVSKGGQLLIGTNLTLPRTEKTDSVSTKISFTENLRLYLGTSDVRGFIESQYKYQNYDDFKNALLFNLGAEFRVGNILWVTASAGIDNYLGQKKALNKLVSNLELHYAFNKPSK